MATDGKYFLENPDSQYHEGVMLDEYQGTFSLVAAQKGKTGEVYLKWGYPQKVGEKKPIDKSLPWKVSLGNQEQAVKALRYFLSLLGGKGEASGKPAEPEKDSGPEDDIPLLMEEVKR